jgi:hypothetical protein
MIRIFGSGERPIVELKRGVRAERDVLGSGHSTTDPLGIGDLLRYQPTLEILRVYRT